MKLVGKFRGVVVEVEKGKNANKRDVLKVTFDVMEENFGGEWRPMEKSVRVAKSYSLSLDKSASGKCPAEYTASQLKDAFDYTGGFSKLNDLVFKTAELICEDHTGKYTQILYVNNPNRPQGAKFEEFSDTVTSELERIFSSVA